ncbi:MAG: DNA-directed RNA polymerase subunit B, partial [Candidatus Bathyarchaeota archaeon]
DQQVKRIEYLMDKTLFPHVGEHKEDRKDKARFLCKMVRKLMLLKLGKINPDIIDHYANKRVRLTGDLLEDLMRANLKSFVNDMLYVFQRGVRRGSILPISSMIQTKFLTQRINSAMATGSWTGGRQGMSQRLERHNSLITISHLRRISSLLQTSQENFEARALHSTHWGRLCPIETPESKNIGLRKNLALLADVSPELTEKATLQNLNALKELGLKVNEK